eukprot:1158448-Pelagomonas_calceolata.AAC.11
MGRVAPGRVSVLLSECCNRVRRLPAGSCALPLECIRAHQSASVCSCSISSSISSSIPPKALLKEARMRFGSCCGLIPPEALFGGSTTHAIRVVLWTYPTKSSFWRKHACDSGRAVDLRRDRGNRVELPKRRQPSSWQLGRLFRSAWKNVRSAPPYSLDHTECHVVAFLCWVAVYAGKGFDSIAKTSLNGNPAEAEGAAVPIGCRPKPSRRHPYHPEFAAAVNPADMSLAELVAKEEEVMARRTGGVKNAFVAFVFLDRASKHGDPANERARVRDQRGCDVGGSKELID